jgi:hypothetical protein
MASDQSPFFFNYFLHKANMMFCLIKIRKGSKQWDLPDTGEVTKIVYRETTEGVDKHESEGKERLSVNS